MIHSLDGIILSKTPSDIVVSCGGVGFHVTIPSSAYAFLPEVGESGAVYTHLSVKEDGMELYGFSSERQRAAFRLLTGVSGVGPKVALAILSLYDSDAVALAVAAGDHQAFTAASGVGPKLAQRIVLELKDKIGDLGGAQASAVTAAVLPQGVSGEAVAALVSLGFTQSEAASTVAKLPQDLGVEEMIAAALRSMGSR